MEDEKKLRDLKVRYYDLLNQIELHQNLILQHRDMIERITTELEKLKLEIKASIWGK